MDMAHRKRNDLFKLAQQFSSIINLSRQFIVNSHRILYIHIVIYLFNSYFTRRAMKSMSSFILITVFFCFMSSAQVSELQIETVFSLERKISLNNEQDLLFLDMPNLWKDSVYLFDKEVKEINPIVDPVLNNPEIRNFEEISVMEGELCIVTSLSTSAGWRYRISWTDLNGNFSESGLYGYKPDILGFNDDFVFFSLENQNGKFEIQKYRKGTGVDYEIDESDYRVKFHIKQNGFHYFARKNISGHIEFMKYSDSSGMISDFVINSSSTFFNFLGVKNGLHYVTLFRDTTQHIWEVNFTQSQADLYAEVPRYSTVNLQEDYFVSSSSLLFDLVKVRLSDLNDIDTIMFTHDVRHLRPQITDYSFNEVCRGYSAKHGFEPVIVTDSIYFLADIGKGAKSGWIPKIPDFFTESTPVYFTLNHTSDTLFSIMTNYADDLNYLYGIYGQDVNSLFPIENAENIWTTDFYEGNFIWYILRDDSLIISWRSVENNLSPQPAYIEDTTSVEWGKNLALAYELPFYVNNTRQQLGGVALLDDGSVVTTTRMARNFNFHVLNTEYEMLNPMGGSNLLFKQLPNGKLAWHRSFGPDYFGSWIDNALHTVVDENGDIYVSGVFFEEYYTDSDTLSVNRCANFLHKFDGQTGETKWVKLISENFYYSDFHIDLMKLVDNEIVLSFTYRNFQCEIDGTSLTNSLVSPINAIAKFDLSGNLILAKNTPTPWTDDSGDTWVLDSEGEKIFTAQSQGAYNISSSCNFKKWRHFNQVLNQEGEVIDTVSFHTSDLGAITSGFYHENNLFGFGFYRGEMDLNYFNNTTPSGDNCHLSRGFMYRYDLEKQEFSELKISNESFHPFYAKYHNGFYYLYGASGDERELTLVKFDSSGRELGYKPLGQFLESLTYEAYQFFDVNDDFLAIIGVEFDANEAYNLPRKPGSYHYTSIIKTRNENWNSDKKLFKNQPRIFTSDVEGDIAVYPNPFGDSFSVMFKDPTYTNLGVFNMSGQKVANFVLNEDYIQNFSLRDLRSGLYIFRFSSSMSQQTIKVIKN